MSFEDWQDQVNAVCEEYEARLDEVEQEMDVGTREDFVAFLDVQVPLGEEYTEAIIDVGVPSERSEEVEQFHDDLRAQDERAQEFQQAVEDDDPEAADEVALEMSESQALNAGAQDLGLPACETGDQTEEDVPADEEQDSSADEQAGDVQAGPFAGTFYNTDDDGSSQEIAITANEPQADGSYSYTLRYADSAASGCVGVVGSATPAAFETQFTAPASSDTFTVLGLQFYCLAAGPDDRSSPMGGVIAGPMAITYHTETDSLVTFLDLEGVNRCWTREAPGPTTC